MTNWNNKQERACRKRLEAQKAIFYKTALEVKHPCLRVQPEQLEIAADNIKRHAWARELYSEMVEMADHFADRTPAWIDTMIPSLTPLHVYGTFCPVCEGDNTWGMIWDYKDPEKLTCCHCGVVMTDQTHAEEGEMILPRSGQTLTYYMRPEEKASPEFKTGQEAFFWAGRPVHTSFTGAIRQKKTHLMPQVARNLAILYHMTGQDRFARASAAVLNRFAEVYPHYVFHDYWNTFMDCDPLYACELMARDSGIAPYEVNVCSDQAAKSGMKSGRYIQTFWGCGRMTAGGVHHEGSLIVLLAEAMDLLWDAKDRNGSPFVSEVQREKFVRDVVVEGLFTFTHWEGVNNKVAGCRVGEVALGRFLGQPEYVHRGVAGFEPYLTGFFNFDGSTNEGSGYYLYAVHNVWGLPEAARGYSDPKSYRKKDRFDNLDLYDPNGIYHTVLKARTLMTLPDGRIPHTADAHRGPAGWPGPEWIHNLGLVRLGEAFAPFVNGAAGDAFALFNRPARLKAAGAPAVKDRFFPGWLLAIFNTGFELMFQKDLSGTASFLMNFYPPKGHDHPDALNIMMFAEGVEVLSDLGYIGDHPLNASIRSTLKHNLVIIDEKDQLPRGIRPPGNVRLLAASANVKAIAADCRAYAEAEVYRRQCVMVHRGSGPAYLVDCFGVLGGRVHDYAIHGEGQMTVAPTGADGKKVVLRAAKGVVGGDIESLRSGATPGAWSAAWTENEMSMRVQFASRTDSARVGQGPGQRDHSEIGKRNDYLFARCKSKPGGNSFVTVIDHYRDQPDITAVEALVLPEDASGPYAIQVSRKGGVDVVVGGTGESVVAGAIETDARSAVVSRESDGRLAVFMAGATRLKSEEVSVDLSYGLHGGEIASCDGSGFVARQPIADRWGLDGSFVEVEDPEQGCWTAYAIASVKGQTVCVDEFPFNKGTAFRIASVFSMEEQNPGHFAVQSNACAEIRLKTRKTRAQWLSRGRTGHEAKTQREGEWLIISLDAQALRRKVTVLKVG